MAKDLEVVEEQAGTDGSHGVVVRFRGLAYPTTIAFTIWQAASSEAAVAQVGALGEALKADSWPIKSAEPRDLGGRAGVTGERDLPPDKSGLVIVFQSKDRVDRMLLVGPTDRKNEWGFGALLYLALLDSLEPGAAAELMGGPGPAGRSTPGATPASSSAAPTPTVDPADDPSRLLLADDFDGFAVSGGSAGSNQYGDWVGTIYAPSDRGGNLVKAEVIVGVVKDKAKAPDAMEQWLTSLRDGGWSTHPTTNYGDGRGFHGEMDTKDRAAYLAVGNRIAEVYVMATPPATTPPATSSTRSSRPRRRACADGSHGRVPGFQPGAHVCLRRGAYPDRPRGPLRQTLRPRHPHPCP